VSADAINEVIEQEHQAIGISQSISFVSMKAEVLYPSVGDTTIGLPGTTTIAEPTSEKLPGFLTAILVVSGVAVLGLCFAGLLVLFRRSCKQKACLETADPNAIIVGMPVNANNGNADKDRVIVAIPV